MAPLQSTPAATGSAGTEPEHFTSYKPKFGFAGLKEQHDAGGLTTLFDGTELVPLFAFIAAATCFNASASGRAWYEHTFARFASIEELASFMYIDISSNLSSVCFFGICGALTFLDIFRWPKFLFNLKIQPEKEPAHVSTIAKVFIRATVFQFVFLTPLSYLSYRLWVWRGGMKTLTIEAIPTALQFVSQFFLLELCQQLWFYWVHRLLHHRKIYKYIHKHHHQHTAPFSFTVLDAHPVEEIFANGLPAVIPQALLPAHPSVVWAFGVWRIFEATTAHAGYNLPFFPDATFHDWHHRVFDGCYGMTVGGIFVDYMFGSAGPYMRWLREYRKDRHWLTRQRISPRTEPKDE